MLSFHRAVEKEFSAVNELIVDQLQSDVGLVENIGQYIVDSGGKRVRPVVVLLSALANNYSGSQHIQLAAVIEFIHTATLLHDDVVDMSQLRRGRITANAQWGNAPSVLVGDFIYSRAFQMLVDINDMAIMGLMANATNVISEGEVQQLANAGNADISEEIYLQVIYRKTAKLFEAAAEAGGMLAGGGRSAMASYGKHLGMAFQIADDVLDYQGDVALTGKNVGDDLAEGKMTLPLIYARNKVSATERSMICDAICHKNAAQFAEIVAIVRDSGGIDYSMQKAQKEVDLAKQALLELEDSDFKVKMIELADFAVSRLT